MAADYALMARNLDSFYNFEGKVVIFVGAGTKQLLDVGRKPKRTIAIDQSAEALEQLRQQVAAQHLESAVEIIHADFCDVSARGDVVYFEFCLHEMPDPGKALAHAKSLAPDIVVFDHAPGSEWAYLGAEEDKVARSSQAMERFNIRARQLLLQLSVTPLSPPRGPHPGRFAAPRGSPVQPASGRGDR